jgi:hypothetical protein
LAVLSMIQGHTFTALVPKGAFHGGWSRIYTLIHGLTAPMFLLGGGLAYGMVSARRQAAEGRPTLDRRIVRRAFTLLWVGYLLQVPYMSPWRLFDRPDLWARTLRIGPLQLVALCLLLCEGLRLWAPTRARHAAALSVLTGAVGIASPWVWQAQLSTRWPAPVGMWFDSYASSQFPFFPWAVFFFLGVLGSFAVPFARRTERMLASGVFASGAAVAGLVYFFYAQGERLEGVYGEHDFWRAGPLYVGFRAALVFAWLGSLMLLEPLIERLRGAFPQASQLFDTLARQSLVAYVVHLLFLYGSPLTPGYVRFGRVLEMHEAFVIFVAIAVFTLAIAVLWDHFVTGRVLHQKLSLLRAGLGRARAARPTEAAAPESEIEASTTASPNL